jgi:hypothetical protein
VLNLNNGDTLNNKLAASGSIVDQLLKAFSEEPGKLIESAYLRCLARVPTEREIKMLREELEAATGEEKRVVVEDLLWSLMTSREFLFNH